MRVAAFANLESLIMTEAPLGHVRYAQLPYEADKSLGHYICKPKYVA